MGNQNVPRDENTLKRRLAALEKAVQRLQTTPRAGKTSISGGRFEILDGGTLAVVDAAGHTLLTAGIVTAGGAVGIALRDTAGNLLLSTDWGSGDGTGLGWPAIPYTPTDFDTFKQVNGTDWASVMGAQAPRQHNQIRTSAYAYCDAGTTGDLRIEATADGGATWSVVGGPWPVTATGTTLIETCPLPAGAWGSLSGMALEARRTGGTGNVYIQPYSVVGVPSAGTL
ncbi:MAG TPA: hypothetical protein VGL93_10580 [Streptosporangiaceae bacterium]